MTDLRANKTLTPIRVRKYHSPLWYRLMVSAASGGSAVLVVAIMIVQGR